MVVKGKRVWFATLLTACIVSFALMFVFWNAASAYAGGRWEVSSTKKLISPGVTENYVITNDSTSSDQVIGYAVTVDLSKNTLRVGYKDYDGTKWGMQTVRNQAKALEAATGDTVVAAVNGDYFNMATGEPIGALKMNGVLYNGTERESSWFGITEDNKPLIGEGEIPENVQEAIGVWQVLVKDGNVLPSPDDTSKQPRTAVGITADGNVVMMVADGRQAKSSGYSCFDLATEMKRHGCVNAVNLDGGGSTTYAARYAGNASLTVANSPSDGGERLVSSSLMVVTRAKASGVFGEAVLTPNNDVYTPGSEVQFQAKAVDTYGFAMDMPENITWRLSTDSEAMGTIDQDGLFTANNQEEGTVGVEILYNGKVVGETSIEVRYPDLLKFSSKEISLGFGAKSDLGLNALYNQREVIIKDSDLSWTIGESNNPDFKNIGEMSGNIFIASEDATNSTATVSVAVADRTEVTASISVTVGQLPTVVWDFEDHVDENGKEISAEEYYKITKHEGALSPENPINPELDGLFVTAHYNNGNERAELVHLSSGEPVRMDSYSLRMDYDFTQVTATEGACFGMSEGYRIPGKPTSLGVWVYAPENTPNFWLRAYVSNYNADGSLIKSDNVVNFTAQSQAEADNFDIPYYSDYLPAGWHYYEAPLATYSNGELVPFSGDYYALSPGMSLRLMYVPGLKLGTPTKGSVYFDDFQFVYGANTNDLNAPVIESVTVNNQTLSDGMTLTDPELSIQASYYDFEEKYKRGINLDNLHVYVDGIELELATKSETGLNAVPVTLPNGTHRIEVSVFDNFKNESRKSFMVTVAADTKYDTVYLVPQLGAPTLNKFFEFDVTATNMDKTSTVTFEMKLGLGLTLVAEQGDDDAFTVECTQKSAINNTYEVKISRTGQASAAGEGVIARLKVLVEKSLVQGSVFSYSLLSGSVVFDEFYQQDITNTFILQSDQQETEAYYEISADMMIVGNGGGYIYVTHDNFPASGVPVYMDGTTLLGTTNAAGKLFTDRFVTEACINHIQAEDAQGNVSFSLKIYGVLPCGGASSAPMFIASKASADPQTSYSIGWFSNPLFADKAAQVKYALKSEYDAKGEAAFTAFKGESTIVELSASQIPTENYAVLFNEAHLTGLQKDADYVYIVGNGVVWSEVHDFSTKRNGTNTNFFVMGDTQLEEKTLLDNLAKAIERDGVSYDFGIQTGDFVDNTNSYSMWSQIMGAFSEYFGNTDMIQVLGNHEFYGDEDGSIASTFHMLPDTDWYSVMYGNTYVAVVNYSVTNNVSEMAKVFAEVAADAQKSKAVWKVLTLHQPPYYTNSAGGNEYVHQIVPQYVDEGGFDVVFSGHDHAYARTKPMKGGVVDESGAVYIVSGAVSDKGYEGIDDPSFNFDCLMNAESIAEKLGKEGYTAVYISVQATENSFTLKSYNVKNGDSILIDTYTITKSDECTANGHTYIYKDGYLECAACGFSLDPVAEKYNGLVADFTTGRRMMLLGGVAQKGWFSYGEDDLYFDRDGIAVQGEFTVTDATLGDFTYIFDNGMVVGGETRWYGNKYYVDGKYITGWNQIDGKMYYFAIQDQLNRNVTKGDAYKGRWMILCPIVGNPYLANYYFIFDQETGALIRTDFHLRSNQKNYSMPKLVWVENESKWKIAYIAGWVEVDGAMYYFGGSNLYMLTGDQVIDGVKYHFDTASGDPTTTDSGKLIGRYFNVTFSAEGGQLASFEVLQNDHVTAPAAPTKSGNTMKNYIFDGWYSGNVKYSSDFAITADIDFTAKFKTQYTSLYSEIKTVLDDLSQSAVKSPTEKRIALLAAKDVCNALNDKNKTDAAAEGISFALYEAMLKNLYEVKFLNDGEVVFAYQVYYGEQGISPADPTKDGNSIKSFSFLGWFDGDEKFDAEKPFTSNATYSVRFQTDYVDAFINLKDVFEELDATQGKAPEMIRETLMEARDICESLTDEQIADAKKEGVSFEQYEEMISKLHEVSFYHRDELILSLEVFEGEQGIAPDDPVLEGNSVKTFTFIGWFHGEDQYLPETVITADTEYKAEFDTVYSEKFLSMDEKLSALAELDGSASFEEVYNALNAIYVLYITFDEAEISDSIEEGLDFALYTETLAEYNHMSEDVSDDFAQAEEISNVFLNIVKVVTALAALAFISLLRR